MIFLRSTHIVVFSSSSFLFIAVILLDLYTLFIYLLEDIESFSVYGYWKWKSLSHVPLFANPWTVAYQLFHGIF